MDIRLSTNDEWELCRQVRLAMVADAPDAFGSQDIDALRAQPEEFWHEYHRRHCDVGGQFFAFDGGRLLGTMRLEAPGEEAEVCSVWVDPEVRGQGVADALLVAVLDHAREQGFAGIHLWVASTSFAARKFYAKHGFVESGQTQPHAKPELHELRMDRPLDATWGRRRPTVS